MGVGGWVGEKGDSDFFTHLPNPILASYTTPAFAPSTGFCCGVGGGWVGGWVGGWLGREESLLMNR